MDVLHQWSLCKCNVFWRDLSVILIQSELMNLFSIEDFLQEFTFKSSQLTSDHLVNLSPLTK